MGSEDQLRKAINIDEPRWDQSTYSGRALHFFVVTNPLNIFASNKSLDEAASIVTNYKAKPELTNFVTEDKLWKAKQLYDSAFHPDTGEKMHILGRMSAQVPMNMAITGGMMTFYKTTPAVIFWQWINQSFNALVNYTNRSGDSKISTNQLWTSYVLATTGAVATALGLNSLVKRSPPIIGRWVPFAAVAAANCINIPLMRAQELKEGIPIMDENNNKLGYSKKAAQQAIILTVISRVGMAAPGMVLTPVIMNYLERRGALNRFPWATMPIQTALVGLCLTFATPLCCALFKQRSEMSVSSLEPELREQLADVQVVYFNKGL